MCVVFIDALLASAMKQRYPDSTLYNRIVEAKLLRVLKLCMGCNVCTSQCNFVFLSLPIHSKNPSEKCEHHESNFKFKYKIYEDYEAQGSLSYMHVRSPRL